jgi:hypothetical protein
MYLPDDLNGSKICHSQIDQKAGLPEPQREQPQGKKPPLFIRSIYPTLHLLQGLTMPKFSQLGEVEKLEV